ncbi:30S ribosomal protein S2 [Kordiimonas pumila]|uniref:Small ribosomal subunit protein uS2 n=1 Tax=Kordiimonas pumila TaxID=2161677 RepID=A0ABV7D257_9PROT|nr:30S ribosomal protein S2 [Kordiimonas pumila]
MAMPVVDMRALLEAGVHFGHQTHRWNPKMAPYIFGARNGIHIIDLSQTVPYLTRALQAIRDIVAGGGRVLFVGTKRQASPVIAEAAKRCGQYYVNHRWLGGMMTNWQTISQSIKRLKELNEVLGKEHTGLTKKETLQMTRQRDKLELSLGGIQDMGGLPDIIIVVDTNRDDLAIAEAQRLGIPVVGVIDTNSSPDGLDFPVPGNDDATRAIRLYCDLVVDAVLDGIQADLTAQGVDLGAVAEAPVEEVVAEEAPAEVAEEAATAKSE